MTTKISDERLAELIASQKACLVEFDGAILERQKEWLAVIDDLIYKRALVKECEAYMQHKDECKLQPDCICGLDALLARVRGET